MKERRLYQSPTFDLKELYAGGADVLAASDPISGQNDLQVDGYDFGGRWW